MLKKCIKVRESKLMKIIGLIPARYNSSRFPGKSLALIHGIPMVVATYRQAKKADSLADVVILTDDKRIYDIAREYDCNVMMTPTNCHNGTERILKVFKSFKDTDGFVNIQGDEPFIHPEQIEQICEGIRTNQHVTTLVKECNCDDDYLDENIVKVALAPNGKAIYFSRSPIPFHREPGLPHFYTRTYHKHIGIYGFTRESLFAINSLQWDSKSLSQTEWLEQLKWLENGIDIYTYETSYETIGIDTPDDLEKANNEFKNY
jgi:3-deoxy-manno-octulosonate cytidylyltransferase (CMP-KDO synthetase)